MDSRNREDPKANESSGSIPVRQPPAKQARHQEPVRPDNELRPASTNAALAGSSLTGNIGAASGTRASNEGVIPQNIERGGISTAVDEPVPISSVGSSSIATVRSSNNSVYSVSIPSRGSLGLVPGNHPVEAGGHAASTGGPNLALLPWAQLLEQHDSGERSMADLEPYLREAIRVFDEDRMARRLMARESQLRALTEIACMSPRTFLSRWRVQITSTRRSQ